MRVVEATWMPPRTNDRVRGTTPQELLDAVSSVEESGSSGHGLVLFEAVDVTDSDVEALASWLAVVGARHPGRPSEMSIEMMLSDDPTQSSFTQFGGGFEGYGLRIPFARAGEVGGTLALARRDLIIMVTRGAIWRLWTPLSGVDQQAELEPIAIGPDGEARIKDRTGAPDLPSTMTRQPSLNPIQALLDEVQAACGAQRAAARVVDDAITRWHLRFWDGAVWHDDPNVQRELGAMGRAGFALTALTRRLEHALGELEENLSDAWFPPVARLMETDDERRSRRLDQVRVSGEWLKDTSRRLDGARSELRGASQLVANTAVSALLMAQQREQHQTERFQRNAALVAGLAAVPAVIAGFAGINVDFWPIPTTEEGTLARGVWIVIVGFAIAVGTVVWWRLSPATGRDQVNAAAGDAGAAAGGGPLAKTPA